MSRVLWKDIVKKKYLKKPCLSLLKKSPKNSPVWNQLISVKDLYTSGRKISVGRGDSTSFWKDSWIGDTPLKEKFPQLFDICNNPEATVAKMAQQGWRLSLRR